MYNGARYHKCDFQVHSPRDINWNGDGAVTEDERKAYSEELIYACRQKGLDAIAITDHHDFAFYPYIKRAAENELDDTGNPVPETNRIVVFPGLELTLTTPTCQAILLLDANFPENLLQSVLTALAITPAPSADEKHAGIQRIPQHVVSDLSGLYGLMNNHDHLKDRFIVLPNVSDSGHGTMLRSGFANYYKNMPCVGGYTDGSVSNLGQGNQSIISGKNREYGFKSIGVFQTSDNRNRTHCDLGQFTTWVKWSEPTAEALRQACLAKESRLSQDEPELPNIWITSITVSNSKFLGRFDFDLSQQYNAIIGGRGTGKSTILEYLRWGLCDQPVEFGEFDSVQNKRRGLIDNTLKSFQGEVHITFMLNDIKHIVKRNSEKNEILLKIGDDDFVPATENQIRSLLPIQAYSQKQLSSVGVRIEELKRFVELPIKQALDQIRSDIRDTESKLRAGYGSIIRKREIEAEVSQYNLEIESLTKQVLGLRKGLKGLSEEDQDIIKQKAKYDNEEAVIQQLQNELSTVQNSIEELQNRLSGSATIDLDNYEFHNDKLIRSIQAQHIAKVTQINDGLDGLVKLFSHDSLKGIEDELEKWKKLSEEFEQKYIDAKTRAKANKQQLSQIQQIEERIATLKRELIDKKNSLTALKNVEDTYSKLQAKWNELHTQKITMIKNQCDQFTGLSDGLIKAEVAGSLNASNMAQAFKTAFANMRIKSDKIDNICKCISESQEPLETWNKLLSELEKLALHNIEGPDGIPATATLTSCGFIESEINRIAANFTADKWIELSVTELEFNPKILYCSNKEKDEYIDFADASAGQQATALLRVLLNQQGATLIIDQPEDDIDSKMSPDIVENIWKAKGQRQLIFTSHNANFVVNGDAELVICCDYIESGDQTRGNIKATGAIDNRAIKDEITLVTEGGRQAFELRMKKYGF